MNAKKICVETDQRTSDVDDKDPKVVINSLDYDSLAKIIMLLPIPERIDMEKVCTKWKEACQLAWYDIKEYSCKSSCKCKSSIGRCYDNRLLRQSYDKEILLRCGKYLKVLSLSEIFDSKIMTFVGDHCKNLTSLEFVLDVNNADHIVQAFTQLDKLKCIKITGNYNERDNDEVNLFEIINSLPEEINEIHIHHKYWSHSKQAVLFVSCY
ncbi:uncharacterized protein LOC122847715 [Aphidius gifuensis]|uniref:uncharacterized protein LOC122847715 n=1 Tax=Aphidius gifuensis TaxID=684658 RepID=UPI001CDC9E1C|nr:uncharacterized protein LOC122847715 [Aphidius gifuensis]